MNAQSSTRPEEVTVGQTVAIFRDNIEQITIPGPEEGGTETAWQWTETRLTPLEYESLQNGTWRGPWTPVTHKAFRQHQHDRTLSLYDLARRKAKTDPAWETYITELDAWNEQISALADGYSTEVPDLPAQP